MAATPPRDPITCHVLDTTTGRPAVNITVRLLCGSMSSIVFEAITNADGRVTNWENKQGPRGGVGSFVESEGGVSKALQNLITSNAPANDINTIPQGSSVWKLSFDTGSYYGPGNTFFPQVDVTFLVKEGEHFHVPLLLGPYNFTTYRGS